MASCRSSSSRFRKSSSRAALSAHRQFSHPHLRQHPFRSEFASKRGSAPSSVTTSCTLARQALERRGTSSATAAACSLASGCVADPRCHGDQPTGAPSSPTCGSTVGRGTPGPAYRFFSSAAMNLILKQSPPPTSFRFRFTVGAAWLPHSRGCLAAAWKGSASKHEIYECIPQF